MANKEAILAKIARNMKQRGFQASLSGSTVVVENGSNDLVVSYVEKSVQKPLGGVDDSVSPFLGIGVAAPGALQIEGAGINSGTNATVGDLLDSLVAAELLAECAGYANDILLKQANAGAGADLDVRIAGHEHIVGLGS